MTLEATAPSGSAGRAKATRVVSSHVSVPGGSLEIWRSRQLLRNLVSTEIRVKYKNSFLGLVWSLLAPAMALTVYAVVFGVVLRNGIPDFVILLFSGLLVWNLFQTCGADRHRRDREQRRAGEEGVVPPGDPGPGLRRFGVGVLLLPGLRDGHLPGASCTGGRPSGSCGCCRWRLLPLIVFCAAMAIFLAAVNVYLRDTQHLIEVVVGSAWFWACPIVYSFQRTVYPKLVGARAPVALLPEPDDPDRDDLRAGHLRPDRPGHPHPARPPDRPAAAELGAVDLRRARRVVLGVSLLLLYGAMVVFGRLAGNFAEELYDGRRRGRHPGRLQAVPPVPREVHVAQGTGHPRRPLPYTDLWALRDVAFEVERGRDGRDPRAATGRASRRCSSACAASSSRPRARWWCGVSWPGCSSSGPASSPT